MLKKLSFRNAKRQAKNYLLYFITLVLAAAMLYSFNSFIFSETFDQLSSLVSEVEKNGMLSTVIIYSALIVIVIGWLVSYMTGFMLQKRSKEFATYMLLGIERKDIAFMYMGENALIGAVALFPGIAVGCLISGGLQAAFGVLLGIPFSLQSGISVQSIGLTVLYFGIIFLFALVGGQRKLRKMRLISLLYAERQNEIPYTSSTTHRRLLLGLSIILGVGSFLMFAIQPFNDYRDMMVGFLLIAITFFCFFIGYFSTLVYRLEKKVNWKYKRNRTVVYRGFTSQFRKSALSFGIIASIFSIGMVLLSTGVSYNLAVNELTHQTMFDLAILHMNEEYDFSDYEKYLSETADLSESMTYCLYMEQKQDFTSQRNKALSDYFAERRIEAIPEDYLYTENRFDSYMKYSDYCTLRKLLGLPEVEIGDNDYLIQCMPYLQQDFQNYTEQIGQLQISGKKLSCSGIYTEPFSQYDGYGNGQEFLIIVPDDVTNEMIPLYSLYVAMLNETVDLEYLTDFCNQFENLEMLDVNYVEGISSETGSEMSRLSSYSNDYLEGKCVLFAQRIEIMLILSLIYVGMILFIAGTVIFSVRLLGEIRGQSKNYHILQILGSDRRAMLRLLRSEIALTFVLQLLPLLPLSIGIVYITGKAILQGYFMVPIFESIILPIAQIFSVTIMTFLVIYALYGVFSYLIAKRDMFAILK